MDIIKKQDKVFISPIAESNKRNGKKRRIWLKVLMILAIILIGASILAVGGYYLWNYFKYKELDTLVKLAPSQTKAYLYFDKTKINKNNFGNLDFLADNAYLQKNFAPEYLNILGQETAIVLINENTAVISKNPNLGWLKNKSRDLSYFDYRNFKISEIREKGNFVLINEYLVLADNEEVLRQIIDTYYDVKKSLKYNPDFSKINKQELAGSFGYAYFKNSNDFIRPLLLCLNKNLPEDFLSADDKILFITFLADKGALKFKMFADLGLERQLGLGENLRYLPNEAIMAFSSANLPKIYEALQKDVLEKNINYHDFLMQLDENIKNNYGLDLEKDLLPLFKNNFEVLIFNSQDKIDFGLISEINNEDLLRLKMAKLEQGVVKYYAKFKPKRKEMILADGTTGIELVPDAARFEFKNEDFEQFKLRKLVEKNKEKQANSFAYALIDHKLFLGSSVRTVKETLKSLDNPNFQIKENIKSNNGLLYFNDFEFSKILGLKITGSAILGFEDGNIINGAIRAY